MHDTGVMKIAVWPLNGISTLILFVSVVSVFVAGVSVVLVTSMSSVEKAKGSVVTVGFIGNKS